MGRHAGPARPAMVFRLASPSDAPHPAVYLFLMLPFGVLSGYLTVTVVYLLTQAGVSVEQSAALVALSYVPHTWKFLWAPIVDTTLSRKRWYLLSAGVTAVGIYATGAMPAEESSLPLLTAVVLISNLAVTFLAMSVESLMAYGAPDDGRGRAGGSRPAIWADWASAAAPGYGSRNTFHRHGSVAQPWGRRVFSVAPHWRSFANRHRLRAWSITAKRSRAF